MVLAHDNEATPPRSIVHGGENDGMEYGAEAGEDGCKLDPEGMLLGEAEICSSLDGHTW